MMFFGNVPLNEDWLSKDEATKIVDKMKPGYLFLPFRMLSVKIRPGHDILHLKLSSTMHLSDVNGGLGKIAHISHTTYALSTLEWMFWLLLH